MAEAGDIEVAVNAAGAEQTKAELRSVEDTVDDVGTEMGDTADNMGDLSSKMRGLGRSLVAGLAVSMGGLLSIVPVVGEVFSGFMAVLEAVAFQLDKKLRPALGPVRDQLFELSEAIFAGDWQRAGQIVENFSEQFANIDWRGILAEATDIFNQFAELVNLDEVISNMFESGANLRIALADWFLDTVQAVNWGKVATAIFDHLAEFGGDLTSSMNKLMKSLNWTKIGNTFRSSLSTAWTAIVSATATVTSWVTSLLDNLNWTKVGNTIRGALTTAWTAITGATKTVTDWVVDLVEAINWSRVGQTFVDQLKSAIDAKLSGLNIDPAGAATGATAGAGFGPLGAIGGGVAGGLGVDLMGGDSGGNTSTGGFSADRNAGYQELSIDGRRITMEQSRFMRNGTASRFRNG